MLSIFFSFKFLILYLPLLLVHGVQVSETLQFCKIYIFLRMRQRTVNSSLFQVPGRLQTIPGKSEQYMTPNISFSLYRNVLGVYINTML